MSDPLWCDIRQQYCRCHDYGKRCDDFDDSPPSHLAEYGPEEDTGEDTNVEDWS